MAIILGTFGWLGKDTLGITFTLVLKCVGTSGIRIDEITRQGLGNLQFPNLSVPCIPLRETRLTLFFATA